MVLVVQFVQIRQVKKHAIFVMELKSVGLAVVTAHTSIRLQIKELPVLIVRTDGVVDVTAQARFNAKNVCSRNVFGRGVSKCAPPLIFYLLKPFLFIGFIIFVACRKHRLIHSISSSSLSHRQSLVSLPPPRLFAKFAASLI